MKKPFAQHRREIEAEWGYDRVNRTEFVERIGSAARTVATNGDYPAGAIEAEARRRFFACWPKTA